MCFIMLTRVLDIFLRHVFVKHRPFESFSAPILKEYVDLTEQVLCF